MVCHRPSEVLCSALQSKGRKDLADALPKEIGFGIGLELREKSNVLTLKNSNKVKPGMVFNVAIGEAFTGVSQKRCLLCRDVGSSCWPSS